MNLTDWVDAELRLHLGDTPLLIHPEPVQIKGRLVGNAATVLIDRPVEWCCIPGSADRAVVYLNTVPIAWINIDPLAGVGDTVTIAP